MPLESKLEKDLGGFCKLRKCLYYKFTSPGNRGVPDRIIIGPTGRVLFLELKQKGKKPDAMQKRHIALINMQGAHATWVESLTRATSMVKIYCLPE